MDLNDNVLCAYLDDELGEEERARVAAALAADAGARLRLGRMRASDEALRAALPLRDNDPFAQAMRERILQPAVESSWRSRILPWAAAAAVMGVFSGYLLPRGADDSAGPGLARLGTAVVTVLEQSPAGEMQPGQEVSVLLTFEASDERFCRVFHAKSGSVGGEGLACRNSQGWALVAWDATAAGEAEGYRPAGANPLIDSAMDALGGTATLDPQDEIALISRQWRRH